MDGQISFIFEQRQPIKGYPELHWTGKRPYTSTQYYPAQLKHCYGNIIDATLKSLIFVTRNSIMAN